MIRVMKTHPSQFILGRVYLHPKYGPIFMVGGSYYGGYDRVSNYWYFHKIRVNGVLFTKKLSGYMSSMERLSCTIHVTLAKENDDAQNSHV